MYVHIKREEEHRNFFILFCELTNRHRCNNQIHSSQQVQLQFPSCTAQDIDILNPAHM